MNQISCAGIFKFNSKFKIGSACAGAALLAVGLTGCGHSEKTVVLQPGPADGHNVYVSKLATQPSDKPGHNEPELPVHVWTVHGEPLTTHSYLKFAELAQIPANAQVISAKLYLFGLTNSLTAPQGNSYYPNSPYNSSGENICVVERVVGGDWDAATMTYDNQPASTPLGQALLPASTSQWKYNAEVDVSTQVQAMVAEPAKNFGFAIKMQTEQKYRAVDFASSAATDPAVRPKLVVVYQ